VENRNDSYKHSDSAIYAKSAQSSWKITDVIQIQQSGVACCY